MLRADVVQAHIVPRSVNDVLGEATAAAGCSKGYPSTYAWALHRQTLLLWKVEDGLQASVRRLHLSEPPSGRTFVELVPHSNSTAVTVVVCTGSGQLHVWLDANFPAPPFSQRLFVSANSNTSEDTVICALSASPADAGASLGFLAVVATSDAALHLYHGSQNGIFPRQFYKPAAAAGPKPGMFGALGSVVKALYSEAFDPLHNKVRSSPSAMAALQLQLLPLDVSRWKLLVMTPEALDCWLLGSIAGQHNSEQLLWSYNLHGELISSLHAREMSLLSFTISSSVPQQPSPAAAGSAAAGSTPIRSRSSAGSAGVHMHIYIWSAHLAATALSQQHALSTFKFEEGAVVPELLHSLQLPEHGLLLPEPQAGDRVSQWQLLPHSQYSSCLLLAPNGTVLEWLPSAGLPKALGSSTENLAISCCAPSSCAAGPANWQLLNASYGVLEFVAQDPAAAVQPQQPTAGSMTPEQGAAANELLFKTINLMFKEYSAGCPYRDLAEGLGDRLARLGVLSGAQGRQLLVAASSSLVDKLAKAGSGGLSSGSLRTLLGEKQSKHDILLAAYKTGGVLQHLEPLQSRAVFEHAEMLAAVAAVLEWQRQQEVAATAGDTVGGVTTSQTAAAAAAIEAAGVIAAEGTDAAGSVADGAGQQWEVFFSRPAVSMPALFRAVATEAAAIKHNLGGDERSGSALHAMQQLLGLAGLLQAAAAGAQAKAAELSEMMPDEATRHRSVAGASWLSGDTARAAWGEIIEACLLLHSRLSDQPSRLQLAKRAHLPALQALLAGLHEAIRRSTSASGSLREQYSRLPADHGAVLLAEAEQELNAMRVSGLLAAASEAAAAAAASMGDDAGSGIIAAVRGALVWPIEVLAQQHHCHELLFNTCELLLTTGLLDSGRLQMHMRQEVADAGGVLPQDSFTFYVMDRWRSAGQLSSLLQLGRQGFQVQLQQYLAAYPSLLWMSEVASGMLDKAAATLSTAAQAEQGSLAKCRRLLCLSKLAARAAGDSASNTHLQAAATARLRQLALQDQLQLGDQGPLTTAQLAIAAVGVDAGTVGSEAAAEAAVAAVEALALMPEQLQSEQHKQLWDHSWLAVLQHTPLKQLAAARNASRSAGGKPEEFDALLKGSPLFLAILRAAAALEEAQQVQGGISPAQMLKPAVEALVSRVQHQEPDAAECMQDLVNQAAQAAFPLMATA